MRWSRRKVERHARQWEKTEERLQNRLDELRALATKERERVQQRDATIAAAREVLTGYFDSAEPRSTQHALEALRRIICGGGF